MPELPEVETVRRALAPHLVGRRILSVETHAERLRHPLTLGDEPGLLGCEITGIERRAKYLIVQFVNGQGLLLHLGMTGRCRIEPSGTSGQVHDRISFMLDDGNVWRYHDVRKFGIAKFVELGTDGLPLRGLPQLGPEPWDSAWDGQALRVFLQARRSAVKPVLMNPRCVVGVGNIYASEVLHRAGISPFRRCNRLSLASCRRIVGCVRATLEAAIEAGGTTIADFRGVDGSEGLFEQELLVYGRANEGCKSCTASRIRRETQAGRTTYWCPTCQR